MKLKKENVSIDMSKGSAIQKYMIRAVGSCKLKDLIKYELAVCFLRNFPGAGGILLRQKFYPFLIGKYGKKTVFFQDVTIRCPEKLYVGESVIIDEHVYFDIKSNSAEVNIGCRSKIMRGVSFETGYDGFIKIDEGGFVGPYTILNGQGGLKIGKNALIAGHCYFVAGNHDFANTKIPINQQGFKSKGIVIEDDVWIGAGVMVLDGVRIGNGAVVCAGAVVTSDIEPYNVMAGIPAQRIKSRIDKD